jgi:hypoxanthine phosphoribosyltransferase
MAWHWRTNLDKRAFICGDLRPLISTEQIAKRVREMARHISDDCQGRTLVVVCTMYNGFVFMADLIRELEVPVVCQFIRPDFSMRGNTTEIFFSPEPVVRDCDVLLVEGLLDSGVTTEFLMRTLMGLGAVSVKLAVLLDRQSARRVGVQPDYFGFQVDETYVVGYGMGLNQLGRNLPFLATVTDAAQGQGA